MPAPADDALAADPDPSGLLEQALRVLAAQGPAAALPLLDRALERAPDARHGATHGRVTRGLVLLDQGEFSRALHDFQAQVEGEPRDPAGWLGLGRARAGLREHGAALLAFDRALALREGWSDAHWHRASSRAALQELAGAVQDLDAALCLLPAYAAGTSREARICMARAQLRLVVEDRSGAREDLVRAAAIFDARGDAAGRDRVIAMAHALGL